MECRRDMHTGFWWGTLKGKTHLKDLSLDRCVGKNKRDLKETGLGGDLYASGWGQVVGFCEYGN